MKKSMAIVLIVVAVVLCACPSLFFGGGTFFLSASPGGIATAMANSQQVTGIIVPQSDMGAAVALSKVFAGGTICLGLAVPVVVGLITLRMARKKAAGTLPPQ
jgi:hypothetical protein